VRSRFADVSARGAVLVISFASGDALESYRAHLDLPFPIAADPERKAYRSYGMLSGSRWEIWHPRVLWKYVVLILKGMKPELPQRGADLSQLGGDFVIDGKGKLRFAHRSFRPDDRPSVDVLLAALSRCSNELGE
jgi:peroxiredoxin